MKGSIAKPRLGEEEQGLVWRGPPDKLRTAPNVLVLCREIDRHTPWGGSKSVVGEGEKKSDQPREWGNKGVFREVGHERNPGAGGVRGATMQPHISELPVKK